MPPSTISLPWFRRRALPGFPHLSNVLALLCVALPWFATIAPLAAEAPERDPWNDKFRQLEEVLPTPNAYRTASGAPGHGYWQQRADHDIQVEIDDAEQRLIGSQRITYTNLSPDELSYLWLQLDQNYFRSDSDGALTAEAPDFEEFPYRTLSKLLLLETFDGGVDITAVTDAAGQPLSHAIVKTMLRIDLPQPLKPEESLTFGVDWQYNIPDATIYRSRGGFEHFEDDDNYLYEIAQWYPRMAAYTDVNGWQHKQFLGSGEFTLEFGDYKVAITVPDDHIVAATGVLQNPDEVLSEAQRQRLDQARSADKPVMIVTPDEAKANQGSKGTAKKTWVFAADNVRDFAFASSRKFIWDAQGHDVEGNRVLAMSFYPNEAEPLWSTYSTHAIIHTLNVYSRYTFRYPYPVAISVNGPVGGMEYPMICFNGPRADADGTYYGSEKNSDLWRRSKYGLISVIIHEVGHNYFPMIVNSDERQWTWMDEGLNSFLQVLAEAEWEEDYPSRRGYPDKIVEYMTSSDQVPIMTNSESLLQFGNNAYGKPAAALFILRETILGRQLFDFAFKEYAKRWRFKRPQPADFFRTMEDASGTDLDWFWRGWFYTTDAVDIAIGDVHLYGLESRDPDIDKPRFKAERDAEPEHPAHQRNAPLPKRVEQYPELKDFYNTFDELEVTAEDRRDFQELLDELDKNEAGVLGTERYFYVVEFENHGGLVMPILLHIQYADGSEQEMRIPAEIWRQHPDKVSKLFMTQREITALEVDRYGETADINRDNNTYPRKPIKSRFQLFKEEQEKSPMLKEQEGDGKVSDEGNPGGKKGRR